DVTSGEKHRLTDGMSDARFPAFDRDGKYLYFTASTDIGPTIGGGEMSALNRPMTRNVYVIVLAADQPSPLAPESDEEKAELKKEADKAAAEKKEDKDKADAKKEAKEKKEPVKVRIDLDGLSQRILSLPVPAQNYQQLVAGKPGILF